MRKKSGICLDCYKSIKIQNKRCRECYVAFNKGENHPMYGVHRYGKDNPNFKNAIKTYKCDYCNNLVKDYKNYEKYKKYHYCNRQCKGKHHSYLMSGEKSPSYIDGRSFLPYSSLFNNFLKNKIKNRDKFTCQNCFITQEESINKINFGLSVHHIDYNKNNCNEDNLITLCLSCNSKANTNRDVWFEFYKQKIKYISSLEATIDAV